MAEAEFPPGFTAAGGGKGAICKVKSGVCPDPEASRVNTVTSRHKPPMLARTARNFQVDGNKSDFNMSGLVLTCFDSRGETMAACPRPRDQFAVRLCLAACL